MKESLVTISQINENIKNKLDNIKNVTLKGEITNLKMSNGHYYLSLKDSYSSISAIIWKNKKLKIDIQNGDEVIVSGKINVFTRNGTFSLHIDEINKNSKGNSYLEYERIKEKYYKLGYFDQKKLLPKIITRLGIITAKHGAALQDILYVLKKNNINIDIIIEDCNVQGINCPSSIISALNNISSVDVIILGRGGGSIDDLMGFSHPDVIEAIYQCKMNGTTIISAVGHEIDFMLSDFVADIRAPTPSIAGEIISNQINSFKNNIMNIKSEQEIILKNKINEYKLHLKTLQTNLINFLINEQKYIIQTRINNYNNKLINFKNLLKSSHIKITCQNNVINNLEDLLNYICITNNFTITLPDGIIDVKISLI